MGIMEEISRKQLLLIWVPTSDVLLDLWCCGVFRTHWGCLHVLAPLAWEASASLLNVLHALSGGSKRASFDWSCQKSAKHFEDEPAAANHYESFLCPWKALRIRFKYCMHFCYRLLTLLTEQCRQWTQVECACAITSKDSRGAAVCAAPQGITVDCQNELLLFRLPTCWAAFHLKTCQKLKTLETVGRSSQPVNPLNTFGSYVTLWHYM